MRTTYGFLNGERNSIELLEKCVDALQPFTKITTGTIAIYPYLNIVPVEPVIVQRDEKTEKIYTSTAFSQKAPELIVREQQIFTIREKDSQANAKIKEKLISYYADSLKNLELLPYVGENPTKFAKDLESSDSVTCKEAMEILQKCYGIYASLPESLPLAGTDSTGHDDQSGFEFIG